MEYQSVGGRPLRAIFFDLVGTLIRSRASIGEQYADVAHRVGARSADPARLGAAFGRAMSEAPPMAFAEGSLEETAAAERDWWKDLVRRVVANADLDGVLAGPVFDRFFAELYDRFATGEAWETYPEVLPRLADLRSAGLAIGLITNYDTRVYSVLDAVGLAPLLDSVTIPALAGAAKPDPVIFARALEALQVAPGEAAFVGDEPADDYAGATAAGMLAILLDRHGEHARTGVRRIGSLNELPGLPPHPVR